MLILIIVFILIVLMNSNNPRASYKREEYYGKLGLDKYRKGWYTYSILKDREH